VTPAPRHESRLRILLPSLCSLAGGLVLWELATRWLDIPDYVLPAPTAVLGAVIDGLSGSPFDRGSFWYHLIDTVKTTLLGFVIGSAIGVMLAALMAESKLFERAVLPYVVILQSLPKIAIAPLFIIWFGYDIQSKVAIASTLTFFPVLLNSLQGFSTTDLERLDVMKALHATRWQTFWRIKFPSALPFVFAGLNLAIVYAQLGAIVSEFVGAQRGMGVLLVQLTAISDTTGVFAVLVVLATTGFILITAMRALHRKVIFWESANVKSQRP
jgi:NitT/TauT family transport system permease protein